MTMKTRKKQLGTKNNVGLKITDLRKRDKLNQETLLAKMQISGANISASSLSKLEGQTRKVTASELQALSAIFNISIDEFLK